MWLDRYVFTYRINANSRNESIFHFQVIERSLVSSTNRNPYIRKFSFMNKENLAKGSLNIYAKLTKLTKLTLLHPDILKESTHPHTHNCLIEIKTIFSMMNLPASDGYVENKGMSCVLCCSHNTKNPTNGDGTCNSKPCVQNITQAILNEKSAMHYAATKKSTCKGRPHSRRRCRNVMY